jgi:NhaP-type Na+/H+ or K+/H+ antiporter
MSVAAMTTVLAAILGWCVFSKRLERVGLSMPIVFVTVGLVFTELLHVFDFDVEPELVKLVAEVTLVWMLFADSSGVTVSDFRRELGSYGRLLGIGLPLTIALGTPIAMLVLGFGFWSALLVGAALAPTDAVLGESVMSNPRVPARIRGVLNVESGLNDGIATPVVLLAIAALGSEEGTSGVHGVGHAALALVVGAVTGLIVGCAGGLLIRHARARGWLSAELSGPATLALALLAFTVALLVDGNGFVAAFVAGISFGNTAGRAEQLAVYFVEQSAELASMLSWLIFGAVALPTVRHWVEWRTVGYAVLSLTVIRMIPVAIALLGAGFRRSSVAFIGWFGPRGLASVIFALLALEDLGHAAQELAAVIGLTVVLSVVAHGLTARPLSRRLQTAEQTAPPVVGPGR